MTLPANEIQRTNHRRHLLIKYTFILLLCDESVFVSFDVEALCGSLCLQDVSGMSLSMLAAAGGHDDILRLLIRKGVRVNSRQKNGTTALMHAAEKVRQPLGYDLLLPLRHCTALLGSLFL